MLNMLAGAGSARANRVKQYALILIGCLIGAAAYPLFLVPNGIAPGGVTGVGMVLHHLFAWPVGMTSLLMNIPLFLMGYRSMGRAFVLRTLATTVLFSAMIDMLRMEPLTREPLLASVFGGAFLGIGLGLILRGGATTGGTDLLARVVHRKFSFISVGTFLFALDGAVIVLAGFTMGMEHAMYAMISVYITTKLLDAVITGLGTGKACYIITRKGDTITRRLLDEVSRGVTAVDATGSYSGSAMQLLVCVVGRMELMAVKAIVREEDHQAFVFITDTHETLGEGFANLASDDI
ncbi:MAG: YitT family protein [Clostridiales bacterium]|nr:YitT family protein [Clostridiales bacterium]